MNKFISLLALVAPLTSAIAATSSEEAKLVYVKASQIENSYGSFGGIPGGGGTGSSPYCKLLGNALGSPKLIPLKDDPSRHQNSLKARIGEVFHSEFMRQITGRIANVRRMSYPGIGDEEARTIVVLIHDCEFDTLGTGPAVLPLKGNDKLKMTYHGKLVPWVLVMSDAAWGQVDGFLGKHSTKFHVPEDLLAHELTHGMTADLLTEASIRSSNAQKNSVHHDVNLISDVSMAYWEGLAEGVEATVGETLKGAFAYPFSMDPGVYGFLLERQSPVRDNKMVLDKDGLPKSGDDLLKSEGFIATFIFKTLSRLPYTLSNGTVIRGWPFLELARVIKAAQPTNTIDLIRAILNAPNGGLAASEEFLRLTSLATYSKEAHELAVAKAKAVKDFYAISDRMHDAGNTDELAQEYARLEQLKKQLESEWAVKSEQWIKQALAGPRDALVVAQP